MSWSSKTAAAVLSGVGLGLVGALLAVNALHQWRIRRSGAARSSVNRPSRSRRQLKIYDTVKTKALADSEREHVFPFRSFRCVWLVGELGVRESIEVERIDLQSEDVVSYRELIHPHATLPAMKMEDGHVMLESGAICLYLAETFLGRDGSDLLPEGEQTAIYYDR